jgi:hypothetical protein
MENKNKKLNKKINKKLMHHKNNKWSKFKKIIKIKRFIFGSIQNFLNNKLNKKLLINSLHQKINFMPKYY